MLAENVYGTGYCCAAVAVFGTANSPSITTAIAADNFVLRAPSRAIAVPSESARTADPVGRTRVGLELIV